LYILFLMRKSFTLQLILTLFTIIAFSSVAFTQETFKYGISNGLSSDEVTSVCKNENYYWIGTTDGLSRFDGYKFKIYKKGNNDENGISSNSIEVLTFDSNGRMWIGYKTKGVDIYYPREDRFVPLSSMVDETLPHRVFSIFEDSERCIWLGSWEEGIFQLIPGAGNTKYKVLRHFPGNIVSSFLEKPKGFLWVGTYYGGLVYNIKNKRWNTFGTEQTITSLVSGGENEIFYSTWDNGVKKITFLNAGDSITGINETEFYRSPVTISKMLKLKDQSLALGSWGDGFSFLNKGKDNRFRRDNINSETPNPLYINNLYLEDDGTLWIGTYGNGLLKYSFKKPVSETVNFQNRINTPVSSIYKLPDQSVLIGTRGQGSFRFNPDTRSMSLINYNSGNISTSYLLSVRLVDNLLLLGSDDIGMVCNLENGEKFPDGSSGKMILYGNQFGKISAIYNQGGNFYFGTKQNGFFTADYNRAKKQFDNFRQYNLIGRDEITGFARAAGHKVWISSHNGLFLYNYLSDSLENYSASAIREAVYCLKEDTVRNRIWLGTSSGTFYINGSSHEIHPFEANKILPLGSIKTLLLDRQSNLWFTIANRLFFYKVDSSSLAELDISSIVKTPIISSEIINAGQTESLLIGSSEGVTRVDIDEVYKIRDFEKVLLTDIDVDLQKIHVGDTVYRSVPLKESPEYIKELELSYKCKWISFYFSATGNNTLKSHYQYRIGGFSKLWENFEMSNPITISQLPPGDYTLEIRKYKGESSLEPIWSMNLVISPPFWKTIGFRLFEVFVILSLAIIFVLSIQKKYKKRLLSRLNAARKEQELELLKEKESFFMGLSHDILTPFTLILSPAKDLFADRSIAKENKKKVEVILKNANFLSDMFSTILDFKQAEMITGTLNIRQFEIIGFSKIILNSFQYLADSKNISLKFKSNVQTLKIRTDSIKYERILYNLLGNSLKYTPEKGEVSLTINSNKEEVDIRIEDTGYGIDAQNKDRIFEKFYREKGVSNRDNKGFGLGLYIVRKFVSLLGGKITLESTGRNGTSFSVTFPNSLICEQPEEIPSKVTEKNPSVVSADDLKPSLVLVEDNDDMRNYLIEKLSVNFNVIAAPDGIEGIKQTKENMPEIIISDLMMPGMDGLTLCRKIKENESLSDIFFIMITAMNSLDDEVSSYKEGVDIFIKKPFDIDVLISQISNILSTRLKQKSQIIHKMLLKTGDTVELDSKDIFIKQAMRIVNEKITDSEFRLEEFASLMHMSLTVLHRKFKVLLGETPNQFIKTIRLKKAEYLLLNSDLTISEIAYLTGFKQSHYFIKCFKEIYNETPKIYRKDSKSTNN
jgi:signal transduction histidine kinase/ligand-binding sensor domain-containing protein/DNA-binding response OmpR family regulator